MDDGIQPGDLVWSLRGRDTGKPMLIIGIAPDGRLLLADGKTRRVTSPKLKQKKHTEAASRPPGSIPDKLRAGESVTNKELRRVIADERERGGLQWPKTM